MAESGEVYTCVYLLPGLNVWWRINLFSRNWGSRPSSAGSASPGSVDFDNPASLQHRECDKYLRTGYFSGLVFGLV